MRSVGLGDGSLGHVSRPRFYVSSTLTESG